VLARRWQETGSCALINYFVVDSIEVVVDSIIVAESPIIVDEAESPIIVAESPIIVADESVVVVVSVFFDWQDVARAIIAMKKKADFTMLFMIWGI
jgi:hypothetical protein